MYNPFACVLEIKRGVHLANRASNRHPQVLLANTIMKVLSVKKTVCTFVNLKFKIRERKFGQTKKRFGKID